MTTCCVCNRDREAFQTLTLTVDEKRIVAKATGKPAPETTTYCKACWKVVTDKVQGAQLMQGMVLLHLRQTGVRNAERLAANLHTRMVSRATSKPS